MHYPILLLVVLGDAAVDPVSGGGGWVGAGLLGCVLAWLLLRHLPAKDAQLERLIETRDTMVKGVVVETKAAIDAVVDHCAKEMAEHREHAAQKHELTMRTLQDLANEIHSQRGRP